MEVGVWVPGVLIGCLAVLVSGLVFLLPETNGRELPQTLDDLNNWYRKSEDRTYFRERSVNGSAGHALLAKADDKNPSC